MCNTNWNSLNLIILIVQYHPSRFNTNSNFPMIISVAYIVQKDKSVIIVSHAGEHWLNQCLNKQLRVSILFPPVDCQNHNYENNKRYPHWQVSHLKDWVFYQLNLVGNVPDDLIFYWVVSMVNVNQCIAHFVVILVLVVYLTLRTVRKNLFCNVKETFLLLEFSSHLSPTQRQSHLL